MTSDPPQTRSEIDIVEELRSLVMQIPRGRVASFGEIAFHLGDRGAARWVATQIGAWRDSELPWYRVLRRNGELATSIETMRLRQAERLQSEGVNLDSPPWWNAFIGSLPLKTLARWQAQTASQATYQEQIDIPNRIGAVDLSYRSDSEAIAAYVSWDPHTHTLLDSLTLPVPVSFPYIPGYLTFRELPGLLKLIEQVRDRLAPVVLVDGSGRLHPRRFGIATALGVLAGICTIGVSKHRLCGTPRNAVETREAVETGIVPLWDGDELLGYRIDGGSKRRTMYVSPGSGIGAQSALRLVQAVWCERRSPEPIHWADAISRRAAKLNNRC